MPRIARVVTKKRLTDRDDAIEHWRSADPADRVAMVQQLRAEYHGWNDAAGPRLQRVHRILHRP